MNNNESDTMKRFALISTSLKNILADFIEDLPKKDVDFINELIDVDEFGVAFETMCSLFFECSIRLTEEQFNEISKVGSMMKISDLYIIPLKQFIISNQ